MEWYRLANAVLMFFIAGTLSWRHFYFNARNGIDNKLRSAASILVFGWFAIASGYAYSANLPIPFTVRVSTVLLATYLLTLWVPWRWTKPRL